MDTTFEYGPDVPTVPAAVAQELRHELAEVTIDRDRAREAFQIARDTVSRLTESHARIQESLARQADAATRDRDLLVQEVSALLATPGVAARGEDGKFYGFHTGKTGDHQPYGDDRARNVVVDEWCSPDDPCSACDPPVDASALREVLGWHS